MNAFRHVSEIPLEQLGPAVLQPGEVSIRAVLPGEIPGAATHSLSVAGPARYVDTAGPDREAVWLILDGKCTLRTMDHSFVVEEETIARAPAGWSWEIDVLAGETLLALRVLWDVGDHDKAEQMEHPGRNGALYLRKFADCSPYKEAIKSAKTVSRTILPQDIVPRLAMGTVETTGPDAVDRHRHPMLEQLFVGLRGNDCTVSAGEASVHFPPLSILHVPLGSVHGVEVSEGRKLRYVWIDCFANREGQEWLKTHEPVPEETGDK